MVKRRHSSLDSNPGCAVEAAISLIDGKWKCVALWYLQERGTVRFNELMRLMSGVTQRTLTNQLRELEADGLINRVVHAQVPPKVEYSLSDPQRAVQISRPNAGGQTVFAVVGERDGSVSQNRWMVRTGPKVSCCTIGRLLSETSSRAGERTPHSPAGRR